MSGEDIELNLLRLRKLKQLQKRAREKEKEKEPMEGSKGKGEESPRNLVSKFLDGKASEILDIASYQFPKETEAVIGMLASLIKKGALSETLDGLTLYHLFLRLGIPVKLKTRIVYFEDGKVKSIAEKLKER